MKLFKSLAFDVFCGFICTVDEWRNDYMGYIKRTISIFTLLITSMLIIPLITVNTVKAEVGMVVTLLLFFVLYPVISVWVGIISGKDIKHFWFTPVLVAVLFWIFSSFTYKTAFPIVYSVIYFTVCSVSMIITAIVMRKG